VNCGESRGTIVEGSGGATAGLDEAGAIAAPGKAKRKEGVLGNSSIKSQVVKQAGKHGPREGIQQNYAFKS